MIKHIVCMFLKDKNAKDCRKACEMLMSMKDRVPVIRDIKTGVDFARSPRSCDVVLEVTVDDRDALEAYQNDPYHCGTVKPYIHSVRESSVSADYEF